VEEWEEDEEVIWLDEEEDQLVESQDVIAPDHDLTLYPLYHHHLPQDLEQVVEEVGVEVA
jgi:hypothetical protein